MRSHPRSSSGCKPDSHDGGNDHLPSVIELRPFQEADRLRIYQLFPEIDRASDYRVPGAPIADRRFYDAVVKGCETIVATIDGSVAGFLCARVPIPRPGEDPGGYAAASIEALVVEPQWRRNGLAKQMLARCCSDLRQAGFEHVRLSVGARNHPARSFYEAAGFEITERTLNFILASSPRAAFGGTGALMPIRRAEVSDLAKLARLLQGEVAPEDKAEGSPKYAFDIGIDPPRATSMPLVAIVDDELVGVLAIEVLHADWPDNSSPSTACGWVQRLFVAPQRQRRGIGTALITAALDTMATSDIDYSTVHLRGDDLSAVNFFKHCGYSDVALELRRSLVEVAQ